jgi:hypothetical protein
LDSIINETPHRTELETACFIVLKLNVAIHFKVNVILFPFIHMGNSPYANERIRLLCHRLPPMGMPEAYPEFRRTAATNFSSTHRILAFSVSANPQPT